MITSVFINVGLLLLYIIIGFSIGKTQLKLTNFAKLLSKFLIYFLCPCMIINSFLKMEYERKSVVELGLFFVISLVVQILFLLLLFIILRKKIKDPKNRILSIGSVLGNVGFLGLPIITGVFPQNPIVACYSSVFVVTMNLLVFTIGVFMITGEKKYISIKNVFLNPTMIGFAIALPLFFFKVDFSNEIDRVIATFASTVTPICMLVLGIRLAQISLKQIFTSKFAYLTSILKLVAFPAFAAILIAFIPGLSFEFKCTLVVLCGMPTGAIITTLAEIHECERENAANVVFLSTLLSVISIPLLVLIISIF